MQITDTLTGNPDLSGIFRANVASCQPTSDAVVAAAPARKVESGRFDAPPANIDSVRNGTFDACVAQKLGLMGNIGVDDSVKLAAESWVFRQVSSREPR